MHNLPSGGTYIDHRRVINLDESSANLTTIYSKPLQNKQQCQLSYCKMKKVVENCVCASFRLNEMEFRFYIWS